MLKTSLVLMFCASVAACATTANNTAPEVYQTPGAELAKLGFDAVALPSTAYGPGSLVTSVKGYGFSPPLRLTYLCRPDFTDGPPPIVDAAASADASRAFNGTFKLDISALKNLSVGGSYDDVQSVTLKFENVKVEQLAYDDLESIRSGLGPKCRELVVEFSKKGIAYQTKQAIKADVTYTANFKRGASADAKGVAIKALQATFGGSVQSNAGSSVTGNGLYYGLVLVKI